MDLNSYVVFAKVVEGKSFTKAAKALHLEKSTVSNKIAVLEKHLGERLLERNTHGVSLTKAGEGFYRYCRKIIDNVADANKYVQSLSMEPQGRVRVSAPPGIERILYYDLFNGFLRQYPKIEVEVEVDTRVVDLVKERYDVALRTSDAGLKDSSLIAKLILEVKFGFFACPSFLEKHGTISSADQLTNFPYIHPFTTHENQGLYAANREVFSKCRNRVIINNVDACVAALQNGLGIGVLPVSSVREEVRQGSIVRILPDYKLPSTSLYVVYASRQWQPAKLKVFLEFIDSWSKCYQDAADNL